MDWISQYQLFLFDLDGLLVNTEELHFAAYKRMCAGRGFTLPWDFAKYFSIAQQDAEAPKRYVYAEFPELLKQEPDWSVLYAEKKQAYLDLLRSEQAPLMPGVEPFLRALEKANLTRVVVTHSAKTLVDALAAKNPILHTIPNWITREDYAMPKPAPDGYLRAIKEFSNPGDRIIGFEDSSRGLRSLMQTPATAILVNAMDANLRQEAEAKGVRTFKSFEEILHTQL